MCISVYTCVLVCMSVYVCGSMCVYVHMNVQIYMYICTQHRYSHDNVNRHFTIINKNKTGDVIN